MLGNGFFDVLLLVALVGHRCAIIAIDVKHVRLDELFVRLQLDVSTAPLEPNLLSNTGHAFTTEYAVVATSVAPRIRLTIAVESKGMVEAGAHLHHVRVRYLPRILVHLRP